VKLCIPYDVTALGMTCMLAVVCSGESVIIGVVVG
jgi:hypothetical protein